MDAAVQGHPHLVRMGAVWDEHLLGSLWAGARCYLHGHSVGGTNPALLSGAASGAEVLAHDNPFNQEVVGREGWLWSDAPALEHLLRQSPWETRAKGPQLATMTIERYLWPDVVRDYEAMFESLVGPRASH